MPSSATKKRSSMMGSVARPTARKNTAQKVPENETEIREWLGEASSELAEALILGGIVTATDLKALSKESPSEIKKLLEIKASGAMRLKEELRLLFG
jgi:hypothetical protein